MDAVSEWSERIALRFAPAEAAFAAEVGTAFAAGGSRRRDVLSRYDGQPGAFGPGGSAELPMILHALAAAGTALRALLGSAYLGNTLAAASLLTALRQGRGHGPGEEGGQPGADAARLSGQPAEAESAVPASEKQAVEQAFATLSERLTAAGFDQRRADELAYGLIAELLADAASASSFVKALTAVPIESPRPRKRVFRRRQSAQ
jgi:hypothetical protein